MFWLPDNEHVFPHPTLADQTGVLALGGDLSPSRLITAYLFGIFPWYDKSEPIVWWCLDPRLVLYPSKVKISKSMRSILKREIFKITFNKSFDQVIEHCAEAPRTGQQGSTWIHQDMIKAYKSLHKSGVAVSVEAWKDNALVGGLYGISLGKVFFGESMFSLQSNASKAAFITLAKKLFKQEFLLIDCQQDTPHMRSLGAELMPGEKFQEVLRKNRKLYLSQQNS
jgi:leucyl/phenylalanyl-tRNA--protein transferase